MRQLETAMGADFDRMWVQMMIKHHQGAVAMATTELEQGENTDATALAQKIVDAQKAEITEMQALSLQVGRMPRGERSPARRSLIGSAKTPPSQRGSSGASKSAERACQPA